MTYPADVFANQVISGKTILIAHLGYPTESFKAPLIYNPWFESRDELWAVARITQ